MAEKYGVHIFFPMGGTSKELSDKYERALGERPLPNTREPRRTRIRYVNGERIEEELPMSGNTVRELDAL